MPFEDIQYPEGHVGPHFATASELSRFNAEYSPLEHQLTAREHLFEAHLTDRGSPSELHASNTRLKPSVSEYFQAIVLRIPIIMANAGCWSRDPQAGIAQ